MSIFKPLFGTPLNRAHPYARGLKGCWLFNEGTGLYAYDSSGNGNHGTLSGFANPPTATSGWGPGPHGGGLAFDGTNDRVNIGPLIKTTDLYVAVLGCIYVRTVPAGQYNMIVGFGGDTTDDQAFKFTVNDSYKLCFDRYLPGGGTISSTAALTPNAWNDVAMGLNDTDNTVMFVINGIGESVAYTETYTGGPITSGHIGVIKLGASYYSYLSFNSSYIFIYNKLLLYDDIVYLHHNPYCMFDHKGGFSCPGQ